MKITSVMIKAGHEGDVVTTIKEVGVLKETGKMYKLEPLPNWNDRGAFGFRTQILKSEIGWVQNETTETSIEVMCWCIASNQAELGEIMARVEQEFYSHLEERTARTYTWTTKFKKGLEWNHASMPEV